MPGDKRRGAESKENPDAANVARLAQAPQRSRLDALVTPLLVFPQCAGELGLDQPWSNRVDADALRPPFGRKIAHQVMVGGLGNAVSADHAVGEQSAVRTADTKVARAAPRPAANTRK